jgi:hypothetical protein
MEEVIRLGIIFVLGVRLGTFLAFTGYKIECIEKTANRRGARVLSFGSGKIEKSEDFPYSTEKKKRGSPVRPPPNGAEYQVKIFQLCSPWHRYPTKLIWIECQH